MEALKEWSTGVQVIDGFAEIHYRQYVLTETGAESTKPQLFKSSSSRTHILEFALERLLNSGKLAYVESRRGALWVFGQSDSQAKPDSTLMEDCIVQTNEFHQQQNLRWGNRNNTVNLHDSEEANGAAVHHQGLVESAQAIIGHTSPKGLDYKRFNGLFLAAVISLISYGLARDQQAIPLNFRTFVTNIRRPSTSRSPTEDSFFEDQRLRLDTLKVQLTSSGSLLVSSMSRWQPHLRQLSHADFQGRVTAGSEPFQLVRLAPSGCIAKLKYKHIDSRNHEPSFASVKEFRSMNAENYHSALISSLNHRGLYLDNLEDEQAWVQVIISNPTKRVTKGALPQYQNRQDIMLDWPIQLCFYYDVSAISNYSSPNTSNKKRLDELQGLQWFETEEQTGFGDPLDFVQDWMADKNTRNEEIDARELKRQQETAAKRKRISTESSLEQAGSPFGRSAPFMDSQMASGVYPTPPDGLPPQTAANFHNGGSSQTVEASGSIDETVMAIFDGDNNALPNSPHKEAVAKSRSMSVDFDVSRGEDLFVDEDEDLLQTANMTEADFSFFDEPELESDHKIPDGDEVPSTSQTMEIDPVGDRSNERKDDEQSKIITVDSNDVEMASPNAQPSLIVHGDGILLGTGDINPPVDPVETEEKGLSVVNNILHGSNGFHSKSLANQNQNTLKFNPSHRRRPTTLDVVSFDSGIEISDNKYGKDGRFGFSQLATPAKSPHGQSRDRTIPLIRSSSRYDQLDAMQSSYSADSDEEDTSSSDSNGEVSTPSRFISHGIKRQKVIEQRLFRPDSIQNNIVPGRPSQASMEPITTSSFDNSMNHDKDTMSLLIHHLMRVNPADWSLVDFPPPQTQLALPLQTTSMTNKSRKKIDKSDLIAIAQVLVDQLTFSAHSNVLSSLTGPLSDAVTLETPTERSSAVQEILDRLFPQSNEKDLQTYATMETPLAQISTSNQSQARPGQAPVQSPVSSQASRLLPQNDHSISLVAKPHLRITKADSTWEVLAPALTFWDTLGLGPCNGPKDLAVYCVYPYSEDIQAYVERFLETMKSTYETLKLGHQYRGEPVNGMEDGLIPVHTAGLVTPNSAIEAMTDACTFLGRGLAKSSNTNKHIVIYLVDPFQDAKTFAAICACFWELFKTYREALAHGPANFASAASEVVLQIVPINFVASVDWPVVLDPEVAANLAREVYDRCPQMSNDIAPSALAISSAAAIQLETPVPKTLQFQLSIEPPSSLFKEYSVLHFAYCRSLDGNWITAAWIDSTGEHQATTSYCLAGSRTFAEVAHEIWDTTLDIIKARQVTWRLFLVKAGYLAQDEKDVWLELTQKPKQIPTRVIMLSVDTRPSIAITPKTSAADPPSTGPLHPYTTPVSTPAPHPSTPDQPPHAPTTPSSAPPAASTPTADTPLIQDADPAAILTDPTQDTWAVVLAHQLNTAPSITALHPALASGYLLKRGGTRTACVAMEVHLISAELAGALQCQRAYDVLLREVLGMYAHLGVLARARGVESWLGSVRPWHVAAVEKGVDGLNRFMGGL